jgi:hypothetical protein
MLDVSGTFAGEAIRSSSCLSRSKSPPVGAFGIVMQFYSGPLMYFLSGVDNTRQRRSGQREGQPAEALKLALWPLPVRG